ncbi:uncharacterized protein LOC144884444 isoform X2 [Branchiostoma floridae x Branchiostoma japonicum]
MLCKHSLSEELEAEIIKKTAKRSVTKINGMKKWIALGSVLRLAAPKETPPCQAEAELELSKKNNVDKTTKPPLPEKKLWPKNYEDVDPNGESIFASGTEPNQQDDENEDWKNVPPPLPARKPLPPNKYEDVDPHGDSIFALGSGQKQKEDKTVDDGKITPPLPARKPLPLNKYEDVDPHGDSIFAASSGPKGQVNKDVDGKKAPPPLPPPRKYEDFTLGSSDVDVVLGCGLKRAVPDVPPSRTVSTGDKAAKQKEENEAEEVIGQEDGDNNKPSLHHLNMGKHIVMWAEEVKESYSDRYYTSEDAHRDSMPTKTPPNSPTETEVCSGKQSQQEKDEDFHAPESTSRLKRKRVYCENEDLESQYEDVDPAGDSIFPLSSGPNEPSLHHSTRYSTFALSSEMNLNSSHKEPPPHKKGSRTERPPKQESVKQGNSKYEDVDVAYGDGGLQRDSTTIPPKVDIGDHTVEWPSDDNPYSDKYYTSKDANGEEEGNNAPGFHYKVEDCITEMWNSVGGLLRNVKCPKRTCLIALVWGLLVAAAVITAAVLATKIFFPGDKNALNAPNKDGTTLWTYPGKSSTPCWTTIYKENDSIVLISTLPSPLLTKVTQWETSVSKGTVLLAPTSLSMEKSPTTVTVTSLQSVDVQECTRNPCQHGRCVNKDGGYKCTCSPGWTGQACQQDINECKRKPCQHGRCVNQNGGYKCTCEPGWTGQNCQKDINECTRNPCQHGGRCVNQAGSYKCTCSPGWTGQKCQQDINECTRNPCQHFVA